ncbi:hypothetical protein EYF80_049533 [Liparis tanakae]|uniref:Uncharacterized protein n=1 Tax=Liparis tanakae TaxID=230148 RepID=A0A4Z2FGE4_9TELE|nr:hypothetical protein EYF80_049533 [Liparis tanakae]
MPVERRSLLPLLRSFTPRRFSPSGSPWFSRQGNAQFPINESKAQCEKQVGKKHEEEEVHSPVASSLTREPRPATTEKPQPFKTTGRAPHP